MRVEHIACPKVHVMRDFCCCSCNYLSVKVLLWWLGVLLQLVYSICCITSYYKKIHFCKCEGIFFFEIFVVNLYSQKSD